MCSTMSYANDKIIMMKCICRKPRLFIVELSCFLHKPISYQITHLNRCTIKDGFTSGLIENNTSQCSLQKTHLEMVGIENLYQFVDLFEDKLQKVMTKNHNSNSLFTSLDAWGKQNSVGLVNNDNKPLGDSPLHRTNSKTEDKEPYFQQWFAEVLKLCLTNQLFQQRMKFWT